MLTSHPRRRPPATAAGLLALAGVVAATAATTGKAAATPIKIAVLSDCQGAFGSFDNQDLAGVVTAMVQFAGATAKNPNKPRDGWTGGSINGHPLKLVGIGCSNDRADTAIKETKRLMEQLDAAIMIGPLSGDESIAVANYAKQHPTDQAGVPAAEHDRLSSQQMPTNVDGTFVAVGGQA
jgi:branched-chain amino acid transport system substrate-binding protein